VKDHPGGVEGHLSGELRPAPPPPVQVTSADSGQAAERAAAAGVKRCADCREWFPVEAYPCNGTW
jgi:hypothetical protein